MTKCTAYKIKHNTDKYMPYSYILSIHSKKRHNARYRLQEVLLIKFDSEYRLQFLTTYHQSLVSTKFNEKNLNKVTAILNSEDHSTEIFCMCMTDFLNKIGIDYEYNKRK